MYSFQDKGRGYVEVFRDGKSVGIGTAEQAKGFGFNGSFSSTPEQQRTLPSTSSISNLSSSNPQILTPQQINEIAQQNRTYYQGRDTTTPTTPAEDPKIKQLEATVSTIPALKETLDVLRLQLQQKLEQGQKVNPDLTITPELTQKFINDATAELDPYYQELIGQHKQDLDISFRQLQEDYTTAVKREQPAFQQSLENQDITEANQGTAFSSGRIKRESELVTGQQERLDDMFKQAQRGVEQKSLSSERAIGSRNFSDLGIPSLSTFSAGRTISPRGEFTETGSRSLYTPQGGLFGTVPAEQKVAVAKRAGELTLAEQNKRILDAGGLARTI